jgi:hypothetical protein
MAPSSSLLAAIRGPVLLIALGVLVSLDFAGKVSFWRTWPVLMIVFGVLKLGERFFDSRTFAARTRDR